MKPILFTVLVMSAISVQAENTPFTVVTRCETADSESVLTVERRVLDVYSAKARFEDRILRDDEAAAVAVRSVSGSVITYSSEDGRLNLVQNHGSMQLTNASGAYTVQGRAEWSDADAAAGATPESYACVTYDHL